MAMERERTFTLPSLGHFPIQSYYNRPNIIKSHLHIRFDVPFASIKKKSTASQDCIARQDTLDRTGQPATVLPSWV
jgi:hypothetical protein